MQLRTATEIEALVAIGEVGFSEELLTDGSSVRVHLTILPDADGGPARIHLLTWKQMPSFRMHVSKPELRCLDDCWALVQEAFFPQGDFSPTAEFSAKAQAVARACHPDVLSEARKVLERRSMLEFCEDLGLSVEEVEKIAASTMDESEPPGVVTSRRPDERNDRNDGEIRWKAMTSHGDGPESSKINAKKGLDRPRKPRRRRRSRPSAASR